MIILLIERNGPTLVNSWLPCFSCLINSQLPGGQSSVSGDAFRGECVRRRSGKRKRTKFGSNLFLLLSPNLFFFFFFVCLEKRTRIRKQRGGTVRGRTLVYKFPSAFARGTQ